MTTRNLPSKRSPTARTTVRNLHLSNGESSMLESNIATASYLYIKYRTYLGASKRCTSLAYLGSPPYYR